MTVHPGIAMDTPARTHPTFPHDQHINRPQANRKPEPDGEAGAVEDGGEAAPPPPVATGKKTWASLVANSK